MSRVAGVVKEFIEDARGSLRCKGQMFTGGHIPRGRSIHQPPNTRAMSGLGYVVHEQYRAEQCQGPRAVKHSLAELDIAQSLLRKIVECAESVRRHGD